MGCCLWPEGLSLMAYMKLFLVSFLSFNWLFHFFDWFEGLEILFFIIIFSCNCQCVGLPEEEEEGSSLACVGVSHSWAGRRLGWGAMSRRADWPSVAHNNCMLLKVIHRPVETPLFSMNHICLPYFIERQQKRAKRELKAIFSKVPRWCRGTSHISNRSLTSKGSLKIFLTVSALSRLCVFWSHHFNQFSGKTFIHSLSEKLPFPNSVKTL